MYGDVKNGDVSDGNYVMNNHSLSEAENISSVYFTNKRDGNVLTG